MDGPLWTKQQQKRSLFQFVATLDLFRTVLEVAMGLRAMERLVVSSAVTFPSLWRLGLLFLCIWELDAHTAVETKPVYIWQTGMVHLLYRFSTIPLGFIIRNESLDHCGSSTVDGILI